MTPERAMSAMSRGIDRRTGGAQCGWTNGSGDLDRVLDRAEPLDLDPHDVAVGQQLRRVEVGADPGRRAGEDDVARLQGDRLGQEVDERLGPEDQVRRGAVL